MENLNEIVPYRFYIFAAQTNCVTVLTGVVNMTTFSGFCGVVGGVGGEKSVVKAVYQIRIIALDRDGAGCKKTCIYEKLVSDVSRKVLPAVRRGRKSILRDVPALSIMETTRCPIKYLIYAIAFDFN